MKRWLAMLGLLGMAGLGCEPPDCAAICERSLACDVTFTPSDDPYLEQVDSGQRSAQASCERGCQESLSIDAPTEACILEVKPGDPTRCRPQVQACLGVVQDG